MSDVRKDYGPTGCARPLRDTGALLVVLALAVHLVALAAKPPNHNKTKEDR